MLPGIGGSELVLIAVVALIVVGPKDLPKLLRQLGRFVAKMRSMADEFRTSFDDMARQSELEDLRKEVEALRTNQMSAPVIDDIREDMRRIENEIHDAVPPKGHFYSDTSDVPSPDAYDFRPDADDAVQATVPVEETVKKPRKTRAKKADEPIETTDIPTAAPKPKRSRAKKTSETMAS